MTVDRIAVVFEKHAIKASDIDRELGTAEFLNGEASDFGPDARHRGADRLIEQTIIRDEIAKGGYRSATQGDAEALLTDILRDRFGGSRAQLQTALARYRLTEEELLAQLLWQLTVLQFIEQRFRATVLITDEDVRTYYDQHLVDLQRQFRKDSSFEALKVRIRASLEGERINQLLVEFLDATRKRAHIRYLQEAFE